MRRKTEEVEIVVKLDEEGEIDTGDKCLDHLLETFFFYMGEDAVVQAKGDLRHHLWEDVGIVLGKEIKRWKEEKSERVNRFGEAIMPMDEALVLVSLDITRNYLSFDVSPAEIEKGFEPTLVKEFINAMVRNLGATLHIKQLSGENSHHVIEAVFKALGIAFSEALEGSDELRSTKGEL
ncbi:MAG: imidazoleglycerol-phosphate dehydratase HisB [Thermoplasmata archaeon]